MSIIFGGRLRLGSQFLVYNWTKQGALYYLEELINGEEEIEVKEFIKERGCDVLKQNQYVYEEMVRYIIENISPILNDRGKYKAWWMGNTSGTFSIKSTWELLRHRRKQREILRFVWNKGVSFKINIFPLNGMERKIP